LLCEHTHTNSQHTPSPTQPKLLTYTQLSRTYKPTINTTIMTPAPTPHTYTHTHTNMHLSQSKALRLEPSYLVGICCICRQPRRTHRYRTCVCWYFWHDFGVM